MVYEKGSVAVDKLSIIKYSYPYEYEFEKIFFGYEDIIRKWTEENVHLFYILALAYCVAIFSVQRYMKSRQPFEWRLPLILWSGSLAIFSLMGAARTIPHLYHVIMHYGLHNSLCHSHIFYDVIGFWAIAFLFSKPLELGDTFFIVFRKQPLIFLHWYHHITVMIFSTETFIVHFSAGSWYFVMNYIVHSFMYTYYTMRAMKLKTPRFLAMTITFLQIWQMVIGCGIQIYLLINKFSNNAMYCHTTDFGIYSGLIMYLSYLALFCIFFNKTYLKPKRCNP